ncbi:MAG: VanW family protein [Eubacterium sp.]
MKNKKTKGLVCIVLSIVLICVGLCACNGNTAKTEATTSPAAVDSKNETVSETTTVEKTTEDLNTTFAEKATQKVYAGLSKDTKGDYPYEIASYTTYYNSNDAARTANLQAAVNKLNNIKIPNGRVFSFNQTVGKRTLTGGYETATVIKDGEFVDGLGGGVCQVSSTVFECVLRANVEIVARTNHTLEIGYVPLGGDATVQWNSKDFKFKNNLGCDVKITMTCNNGNLTCKLYAKKDVDVGDVKIKITNADGKYTLTRTVNGKTNYTTTSTYKKPQPTETTKPAN